MMYKLNAKTWLEKNNDFVIGKGRAELLRLIVEEGSLMKAAKKMNMSYRHAWGSLNKISEAAGGGGSGEHG